MSEFTNDKLLAYAHAYKFLRINAAAEYGDNVNFINETSFIADNLEKCLNNGIISAGAAADSVWHEHGITVEECSTEELCMEFNNPYSALIYDHVKDQNEIKKYWPFPVKRVLLPNGWRLEKGCDCSRNIEPSTFRLIDGTGKTIKSLVFLNMEYYQNKSKRHNIIEMVDSVFDETKIPVLLHEK